MLLAPGGEDEDGFLQSREIVDLDLRGTVIVLSACRSASGTVLRGEGLLGLGRAFFQAGARAVVGNLWSMRDDEAEAFVTCVSRRLLAGVVVLGDGDVRPIPPGGSRVPRTLWWAFGAALLLLAATALFRRMRSRNLPL